MVKFYSVSNYIYENWKIVTISNNDLDGISFGQDTEGKWGYIPSGADTVIPFKSGGTSLAGKTMSYSLSSQFPGYSRRLVSSITIPYIPIYGVSSITTKITATILESYQVKYRYRSEDGTTGSYVSIANNKTYTLDNETYPFIDIYLYSIRQNEDVNTSTAAGVLKLQITFNV